MAAGYDEPDRGYAWVMLVACFCLQFLISSSYSTFGIFLIEYVEHFAVSKATASWIGALMLALTGIMGILTGPLVQKYGSRIVAGVGTVLVVLGSVTSAMATNVYLLYLTHGFICGTGYSCWILATSVVVQTYFRKRRGLAIAISASGLSTGVLCWPPYVRTMIGLFTWRGALFMVAAGNLHGLVLAALMREPNFRETTPKLTETKENGITSDQKESVVRVETTIDDIQRYSPIVTKKPNKSMLNYVADDSACVDDKEHCGKAVLKSSLAGERDIGNDPLLLTNGHAHPPCGYERCNGADPSIHDDGYYCQILPENNYHSELIQNGDISSKIRIIQPANGTALQSNGTISKHDAAKHPAAVQNGDASKIRNGVRKISKSESESHSNGHCACQGPACDLEIKVTSRWTAISRVFLAGPPAASVYYAAALLTHFGHMIPYTFLPIRAVSYGIEKQRAAQLISVLGLVSGLSRLFFGWLGDLKCMNRVVMYGTSNTVAGLLTAFSIFANSFELLLTYAVLFGTLAACYTCVQPTIVGDLVEISELPRAVGQFIFFIGLGLLTSTPLGGLIMDLTGDPGKPFLYLGVVQIGGGMLAFVVYYLQRNTSRKEINQPEDGHQC